MRKIPKEVGAVIIEARHMEHILDALYAYGFLISKAKTSTRDTVHLILSLPEEGEQE